MSNPQETGSKAPRVRIAPAPIPPFMAPRKPEKDVEATPADKPGLAARALGALQALVSHADKPAPQADAEGLYTLEAGAKLQKVPSPLGTPRGTGHCLVAQGLALPPGGAAWLVSYPLDADPTEGAVPLRSTPSILRAKAQARVRVIALVDEFGRVFACDSAVGMSPARVPDVQFKRYANEEGRGCVDVAQENGRVLRACEFAEGPQGITLTNSRVDLGDGMQGLSLCAACAAAFLAFWYLPHKGGYSLQGVSVRDAIAKLRGSDVFAATLGLIDVAAEAEQRPNVLVPGVVSYAAQTLERAGFGPGVGPMSLVDAEGEGPAGAQGGPSMPGLPVAAVPVSSPEQAHQLAQTIVGAIRGALASTGIPGLTVLSSLKPMGGGHGLGLGGAPQVKLTRTTKYANCFYVAFDANDVSAEGARMLLEAEGLFNRLVMMQQGQDAEVLQSLGEADAAALDAWIVDNALVAAMPYLDGTQHKVTPAPAGSPQLDVRLAFARGCESLRLPYRLEYEFDYDAPSHTLVVEMGAMPVCVMPRVRWDAHARAWSDIDEGARAGLASRYAAFCAQSVAAVGFWACPDVERVFVNVRRGFGATKKMAEFPSADDFVAQLNAMLSDPVFGGMPLESNCILTVKFDRARFVTGMIGDEARTQVHADPFELISRVPHAFGIGVDGTLSDVRPIFSLSSVALGMLDGMPGKGDEASGQGEQPDQPEGEQAEGEQAEGAGAPNPLDLLAELDFPQAAPDPEVDTAEMGQQGWELLRARRVCDMGIFEGSWRKDEAGRIMDAFENQSGMAAIACARDACARTENPLYNAALMRVIEGIATDGLDEDSRDTAVAMLDDIYGLQPLMGQAAEVVQDNPGQARRLLEQIVARADGAGWFTDSKTRAYRYFDAYASRALYAYRCTDDLAGRELRLCADEYYMAHYRLSTLLEGDLDSAEDAIAHARRCVELAPGVATSHLRLARCYFSAFDYNSEIEALKAALPIIWNPKDMGLALYWLGYAFCMTDAPDAGMACYQRAVSFDRSLAETCSSEMADFAKKKGWEPKTFTEREANLALRAVGVDLALHDENVQFLVKAAGVVLEAGNRDMTYKLLGAAGLCLHDDAIAPVLTSLETE